MSCLLVSEMNCLWISWFANISLHSGLTSSFLKISFAGHLLWNWSRSHFPSFGKDTIESISDLILKLSSWSCDHPSSPSYTTRILGLYPSHLFPPLYSNGSSTIPQEIIILADSKRASGTQTLFWKPLFFWLLKPIVLFSVSYFLTCVSSLSSLEVFL